MKSLSVAMLIVSSIVGVGFASGREIVAIFGMQGKLPFWIIPICIILIFFISLLFLSISRNVHKCGNLNYNQALFGKFGCVADVFSLINSFVIFAAMLSAFAAFSNVKLQTAWGSVHIASLAIGFLGVLIAKLGIEGLIRINTILVPFVIISLTVVPIFAIKRFDFSLNFAISHISQSIVYVGLNMYLASNALFKMNLSKRQTITSASIASMIFGILLTLLVLALNGNPQAFNSSMPILIIAKQYNYFANIVINCTLVSCIFTSLIIAIYNIVEFFKFTKSRFLTGLSALCVAFAISGLGFKNIVTIFYPAIGVVGIVFIIACILSMYRQKNKDCKCK
ncbi:MAG: hypothetical protein LBU60_06765 [Clostridiales bacterium]|jgi:uncharacterized membrane protein YkvI|nr:hypothetical protein [Clostridiales bacterium]